MLNPENAPNALNPARKVMDWELTFMRDVAAGWPHVAGKFLKAFAAEHPIDFKARQDRPDFEDYLNPVLDAVVGRIFQREPVLTGPQRAQELWDDIDGRGNRGNVFAQRVARDALLAGQRFILVDYPSAVEANNAVEQREKARAYWVSIALDEVTNFDFEFRGGNAFLTLFAFHETVTQRDDFLLKLVDQWRVFRHDVDANEITFELWRREDDAKHGQPVRVEGPTLIEGVSRIPVVSVNMNAVDEFESTPPFLSLAQASVNHYRTTSDMHRAHEMTSYGTLFGAGFTDKDTEGNELAVGPGTRLFTDKSDASLQYVNADGVGVELGIKLRTEIRASMAVSGLSFLEQKGHMAETATAKALDGRSDDDRVRTWTETLEDALNIALFYTAEFEGIPAPTIEFEKPKTLQTDVLPGQAPSGERQDPPQEAPTEIEPEPNAEQEA